MWFTFGDLRLILAQNIETIKWRQFQMTQPLFQNVKFNLQSFNIKTNSTIALCRSIRTHSIHDGCDLRSYSKIPWIFLLSSDSERDTNDLRLTWFVSFASANGTLQRKLLKSARSKKFPSNFLQNFIPFKFASFLHNFLEKKISFKAEALGRSTFRKTMSVNS